MQSSLQPLLKVVGWLSNSCGEGNCRYPPVNQYPGCTYREHNPGKLNEYMLQKTLRKWEGRYDQLFKALEKKYADKSKAERKRNRRRQ